MTMIDPLKSLFGLEALQDCDLPVRYMTPVPTTDYSGYPGHLSASYPRIPTLPLHESLGASFT